ncbi:MAG: hypothetical protein KA138_07335 [Saprospiraceae bacterium]|nr:hypothetical protein [Saprospiraceae bacterium]
MKHHPFLFFILALLPCITYAQPAKIEGKCGDTLENEFKDNKETQDIEIAMGAGDIFEVMVVPVSDALKIRAEVYDAENQPIVMEEPTDLMFKDETVRSITLNSGQLKSDGIVKIRLFNFSGDPGSAGVYNTYVKCIKSNGDIINPK